MDISDTIFMDQIASQNQILNINYFFFFSKSIVKWDNFAKSDYETQNHFFLTTISNGL